MTIRSQFSLFFSALIATAISAGCNKPPVQPVDPAVTKIDTRIEAKPNDLFEEVADKAGLKYRWEPLGKRPLTILQTIGNGCAFLDYDNDGNLDVLLTGQKPALFKGDGKGNFKDVTIETGFDKITGYFIGCAVGDYDNDGYPDLYLTGYREGRLIHNEAGKGFKDVTSGSNIAKQPWGTSCSFGDIDNDGKVDLYICNYAVFDEKTKPQLCNFKDVNGNTIASSCGPRNYTPEKGVLYRNLGGGKFKDVTLEWRANMVHGRALGVAIADYDNSGRQSILIANDEMPGDLLQNTGKFFHDAGVESTTAYDKESTVHGGMGADWGDFDNDGKLDLTVATFQREAKCVYQNVGGGIFSENSNQLGVAQPSAPYISFGVKWIDIDNDGYLDLLYANGHVQDNIEQIDKSTTYKQPMTLLRNLNGTSFEDVTKQGGPGINTPIVGRGLATGDFDNDGKLDALVVDSEGKPLLLHNLSQSKAHWVSFKLVGKKTNRMALGSQVILEVGGKKFYRHCATDGSYLSATDTRVHFGLGTATAITKATVLWTDGARQTFDKIPTDQVVTLTEK